MEVKDLKDKTQNVKGRSSDRRNLTFFIFNFTLLSLLILYFSFLILHSNPVAAAEDTPVGKAAIQERLEGIGEEGAGFNPALTPAGLLGLVVRRALVLLGVVFFALLVYGGALMLVAGGNEELVRRSKKVLSSSIIGLIIVVFAGSITQFIVGYASRAVRSPEQENVPEFRDISLWEAIWSGCGQGETMVASVPDDNQHEASGLACRRGGD